MALSEAYKCSDRGLILPLFNESKWHDSWRSFLYLVGLLYSFIGVAVVSDVLMCAIKKITSATRKVKRSLSTEVTADNVSNMVLFKEEPIWNPTVANLTLKAFGNCAPEILLVSIETLGHGCVAGELGPGTIIGSAALNFLCILGICVTSLPADVSKRIEHFKLFAVTATFSTFAYTWLLIILKWSSPNEIQVWEGVQTLVFYVIFIVAAFLVDRRICCQKSQTLPAEDEEEDINHPLLLGCQFQELERNTAMEFPGLSNVELARLVAWRISQSESRDHLWYRIQACQSITSSKRKESYWNLEGQKNANMALSYGTLPGIPAKRLIEFDTSLHTLNTEQKRVQVRIVRRGRNTRQCNVRIMTINGSAIKNTHFIPKKEQLRFEPGESEKQINIELIEDAPWKPSNVFYVQLQLEESEVKTELGRCKITAIQFVEKDDMANTVEFAKNNVVVYESYSYVRLGVHRHGDPCGHLSVSYHTHDGTAECGQDYISEDIGELHFENNQVEKYIDINIIDHMGAGGKEKTFMVTLSGTSEPENQPGAIVTILSDQKVRKYFRNMDKLVPKMLAKLTPGHQSFRDQIINAISVNSGDFDNATTCDTLKHILAFPWKVTVAFVPPSTFLSGWPTFIIALVMMGFLVTFVADLASIFGCLVGLNDFVTGITLVTIGFSLPNIIASQHAAKQENSADNAIGNIASNNTVMCLFGLGLAWLIAAIYCTSTGAQFNVTSGTLGFSIALCTILSSLCMGLLLARRLHPFFGKGELGGRNVPKWISGFLMLLLWIIFVILTILQAYGLLFSIKLSFDFD